jgi:serine/threonine protein kinase
MIGETISHYRILNQIGAGGMGVVYRARDEQLKRDVALKVLSPRVLADDGARSRFRREALSLSHLNHPNICTIYEISEANGQTYIVMEYIDGLPLSESIPLGGLAIETTLRYGTQIADALSHAHKHGLLHPRHQRLEPYDHETGSREAARLRPTRETVRIERPGERHSDERR